MAIKYSLCLPQGFAGELADRKDPAETFDLLVSVAQTAERAGYHAVYAPDHLVTVPPSQSMLFECWTTVAALLRETERIRVGQLVTCNDYHHPALQAKMASTADALGKGRFTFGIGAGWYEPDYYSYGFEFHDNATRLRRLEEAVQIIISMWEKDETTFAGRHYTVTGAINQPKGVQQPRIPMMIAGGGEKMTLKLVARYADLCNLIGSPTEVARKLDILRRHCEAVGRDFDSIQKTVLMCTSLADTDEAARGPVARVLTEVFPGDLVEYGLIGTVDTIRDRIAAYDAIGVDEFVMGFTDPTDLDALNRFAEAFIV